MRQGITLERPQKYTISPDLEVWGGDSCSEGPGFESKFLDGHVFTLICLKIVRFV